MITTTRPTILVTGATGKTGGAVVRELAGKGWPVRAVVRKRDARSERLDRLGAETVVADLFDPEQLLAAMRGTARAYYCPPIHPYMIQSATAFAAAAHEARLESVVNLSMWLASPSHPALHVRQHWLVENLLAAIPGVASTVVNPGIFADPLLGFLPIAANLGSFPNPFGEMRNAPPSNEDMARLIAAVLLDPARHAGKRYRPTGPKLLSMADIARIIGRVVGRTVALQDVPEKTFLKAAKVVGADQFNVAGFQHYIADAKRGAFAVNAPTGDVADVTGQPAEEFEATARRYASLPNAQRTFRNKLGAMGVFMKLMVTRAYDLDSYDAEYAHPQPARPLLAADSKVWANEHRPPRPASAEDGTVPISESVK